MLTPVQSGPAEPAAATASQQHEHAAKSPETAIARRRFRGGGLRWIVPNRTTAWPSATVTVTLRSAGNCAILADPLAARTG